MSLQYTDGIQQAILHFWYRFAFLSFTVNGPHSGSRNSRRMQIWWMRSWFICNASHQE